MSWRLSLPSICILLVFSPQFPTAPSFAEPAAGPIKAVAPFYGEDDPLPLVRVEHGIGTRVEPALKARAWIYAHALDELRFARHFARTDPTCSIVIDREVTLGELAKWRVIGLGIFLLLLSLLVGIFVWLVILQRRHARQLEGQRRLAGIVESAEDAVIAVDTEQRIVIFNAAAEKIFGCGVDEAVGSYLDRFIPGSFRAQHSKKVLQFGESEQDTRSIGGLNTFMALRANGEEFPIEASISHVETASGKLFTAIIRDNTEHEKAERQLHQSYELNLSILQSLKNHLAVLDADGTVIAATARGPEFIAVSGINLLEIRVGDNYLETCRALAEHGDRDVVAALEGVKAVYDRKMKYFEMRYDYKEGIDKQWFLMTVMPMRYPGRGVVISHEDITVRKRHEQAIHELNGRLINAQEEERRRIARELHDDINQQVAMLAIDLQQMKVLFPKESTEGIARVDVLWERTHALSLDIQHLSHQLHSTKLDHLGIAAALRGLCSEVSEQCKIAIEFEFKRVPAEIGTGVALSIFRVAQESLHNVAKHSHASNVRVELLGSADSIMLRIKDNGTGFDPEENQGVSGLGMVSMRERMRLVNGTLTVTSTPLSGTLIEAKIPITHGDPASQAAHGN
ncbi:MAG TPA: PAS domain S-box protein [Acidobacteriaceae bacterium]|nr:PAS domain S-box protein [Acidobacteriaceae bacterium]